MPIGAVLRRPVPRPEPLIRDLHLDRPMTRMMLHLDPVLRHCNDEGHRRSWPGAKTRERDLRLHKSANGSCKSFASAGTDLRTLAGLKHNARPAVLGSQNDPSAVRLEKVQADLQTLECIAHGSYACDL